MTERKRQIHPTAVVHPKAELGEEVQIGPYAVIGEHVTIGDGTQIGPHAVIEGRTTLGRRNRVFSGAVVGSIPQDLKFRGETSHLTIGDDNRIREFCDFNTACGEGEHTRIGSRNLFMAYVHIAHNCVVADDTIFSNGVTLAGHVTVDSHAVIGGLSGVHQFVTIGSYCMIGGMTKIVMDVMPWCMVDGNPAKTFGINTIGLERAGYAPERIKRMKECYRITFRTKLKLNEARDEIAARPEFAEDPDVRAYLAFFDRVKRGVTR